MKQEQKKKYTPPESKLVKLTPQSRLLCDSPCQDEIDVIKI